MSVENADRVDRITAKPDGSAFTLVMVEERPFGDSEGQLRQLVDKVNAYVEYIQRGQFHEDYPQARGKELKVRLVCVDEPTSERLQEVLRAATYLFAKHGADFGVEIIPVELLGPGGDGPAS